MKTFLTLALALIISNFAYAVVTTSTVRTSSGQLVSLGDTYAEMAARINQSPVSMRSYETKQAETTITVSDYTYEIENILYTFTVINNQIQKITWMRKDD